MGERPMIRKSDVRDELAAGNGVLNRRKLLESIMLGAAGSALAVGAVEAEPLPIQPWMKVPGRSFEPYGAHPSLESKTVRVIPPLPNPATQGVGTARTPHHLLDGIITP